MDKISGVLALITSKLAAMSVAILLLTGVYFLCKYAWRHRAVLVFALSNIFYTLAGASTFLLIVVGVICLKGRCDEDFVHWIPVFILVSLTFGYYAQRLAKWLDPRITFKGGLH